MIIEPITNPFTILIDTAEGQPFTFQGFTRKIDGVHVPVVVPRQFSCLGRHPHSLGDYSIAGLVGQVAIERKSIEDAWGTVMGWETPRDKERGITSRRDRFEQELANLAAVPSSVVVVEATFKECLLRIPQWGSRPADENATIFGNSVISFQQRFKVPWAFCESRRDAEGFMFAWMRSHWKHLTKHQKQEALERAAG